MILAVLDDLMFSSKIKTAANGLGVDLRFSRSVDGAIRFRARRTSTKFIVVHRVGRRFSDAR